VIVRRRAVTGVVAVLGLASLGAPLLGWAQGRYIAPESYSQNVPYDGRYTYARIRYAPPEFGGYGGGYRRDVKWDHDYPRSDRHFPKIIQEITTVNTRTEASNIFTLDDPELMKFPVAYLCEAGFWRPTDAEVSGMRNYLLKGGFVIFDDFEDRQWVNFEAQFRRALPDAEFIPLDLNHPIYHAFFDIRELNLPHPTVNVAPAYYGVFQDNDPAKRMLALVNHNADIAEYWEFSGTGRFVVNTTNDAYKLGVNYFVYGLTH
jgi:hypothetical protein